MASARIQRWALTLAAYQYTIKYKKGQCNANADALSRMPLSYSNDCVVQPAELIYSLSLLDESPITSREIRLQVERDPVLSRVYHWVIHGWTMHDVKDPDFKPYFQRKDELAAVDGILTWGMRVVVPPASRAQILKILHDTHIGISRMKALARSYVLWPGIDTSIEEEV